VDARNSVLPDGYLGGRVSTAWIVPGQVQHTGCRVPHVLPLFLSLPFRKWCCAPRGEGAPRPTLLCASDGRDVETPAAATSACPPHTPPVSVVLDRYDDGWNAHSQAGRSPRFAAGLATCGGNGARPRLWVLKTARLVGRAPGHRRPVIVL
jgi:hypothetical protein